MNIKASKLVGLACFLLATTIVLNDYGHGKKSATTDASEEKSPNLIEQIEKSVNLAQQTSATPVASAVSHITPLARPGVEDTVKTVTISTGDSLMSVMLKAGVRKEHAHQAIEQIKTVYDPKSLKSGQEIDIRVAPGNESGELLGISFKPTQQIEIDVKQSLGGVYSAHKRQTELRRIQRRVAGQVTSSFYSAALRSGVPPQIVRDAIKALNYDVNWQHDPQVGDAFEITFDAYVDKDGNIVKPGDLQFASFAPQGVARKIYRFQNTRGEVGYFNENGESIVKALLTTPIDSSKMRVTSKFGLRHHPLLHYTKHHKGVDFGAAVGTAVRSAGNGVVMRAGWFGAYGNYVLVKHNNDYSTAYAHLSHIKVRPGMTVKQGQIIGNVGMTGRTTGPHLHYEVIYRGQQVNPQTVSKKLPSIKLTGKEMDQFKKTKLQLESVT